MLYGNDVGGGQVAVKEACAERWRNLFRPPTQLDYATSDVGTYSKHMLQFIDPVNIAPLCTRAMIVTDSVRYLFLLISPRGEKS